MQRAAMILMVAAVLAFSALGAGCGNDGTASGTSAGLVESVDTAAWSNAQLFYAPSVSSRLMTADELGDTTGAIPVRLEFLDDVAVAWYAPHGEAIISHDTLIAAYPIARNAAALQSFDDAFPMATPTTGETHPATSVAPPRATGGLTSPAGGLTGTTAVGAGSHASASPGGLPDPQTFLRWSQLIRESAGLTRAVGAYHPGCG